jgi:hypothetical protein
VPCEVAAQAALPPRLAALLATSYLLIATSYVPPENCGSGGGCGGTGGSQVCEHLSETATFRVSGACGPEGDVVVSSAAGECGITVQGAGAVGLPSAGRFETREHRAVSLSQDVWTLSGYLPEAVAPGGTAGPHATPTLRRCTASPKDAMSSMLACTGGGVADCEAVLTRY